MQSKQIRQKFLDFFKLKKHIIIPSAPLIPENDPTVLFTTAGMQPLVPFLLGEPHPAGKRLANIQKCIRTNDIDEVGDSTHLTFFEMLGNWSLGDYFKSEAIKWSYEFLTKEMGLEHDRINATVFSGDSDAPRDEESARIWQEIGIPPTKIFYYGKKSNWWERAGQTGPCGPDSEIHYDLQPELEPTGPESDESRYVEIWNNVFMQYNKTASGKYELLTQTNVDTGMGFERLVMFMQNKDNVFDTDLFLPIMDLLNKESRQNIIKSQRIIADHLRTAIFLLSEKLTPSNLDQGYVLRRVIRRAIRHLRLLNINQPTDLINSIITAVINNYSEFYPELASNELFIRTELLREFERFDHVLEKGIKEFNRFKEQISQPKNKEKNKIMSGRLAFKLYDTYGFPIEMTQELAAENGIIVDLPGYQAAYDKHQELSRQATQGKFKGGLADHSQITTAYHTATHLLHASLRKILGTHIEQRGSNITAERMRFDFSHPDKLTVGQISEVEAEVNRIIKQSLIVEKKSMKLNEALAVGAIGLFTEKYGDQVTVYTVKNKDTNEIISQEICGGPHVHLTSDLGEFKIIKEESSSAGVRRIKAILKK